MSNDRVLEDVQSWLNQHGYALEMEVARQLNPHCSMSPKESSILIP
jgi:hypothetical protein